jgi:hypothetical protein
MYERFLNPVSYSYEKKLKNMMIFSSKNQKDPISLAFPVPISFTKKMLKYFFWDLKSLAPCINNKL